MPKLAIEKAAKRLEEVLGKDFTKDLKKLNEVFSKKKPEEKSDDK